MAQQVLQLPFQVGAVAQPRDRIEAVPLLQELKHGPLALVDTDMPAVAVAPRDDLVEKLKSNLQEVRARGGML